MTQQEIQNAINKQQRIILERKSQLRSMDYIGIKIAMGVASKSDYAKEIAETEQWREDINSSNDEIARLRALGPDEEILIDKNFD